MKARATFLLLFLFASVVSYCQGEANNWIFGNMAGIQFTTGAPEDLNYPQPLINNPSTVVSDSAGNLLFYSDGFRIYNRNFEVMENGTDIMGGRDHTSCIAFAKPGSSRFYYLFTVGESPGRTPPRDYGGRYAIIDMQANGGLGKVSVKNIMLDNAEDAMVQLTATFHKNNHDIWLLLECQDYDHYFYKVYLATNSGIFYKHKYEQVKIYPGYQGGTQVRQLRVSPDGKKMIHAGDMLGPIQAWVYSFNNETGEINYTCAIKPVGFQTWGAEFSPSSEFAYISGPGATGPGQDFNWIVQYNANFTDSVQFNNSRVIVGKFVHYSGHGNYGNMQCGPDGKIYGGRSWYDTLFAINKPDLQGMACEPADCEYVLNGKSSLGLPQFLTSYAQRFYFTGTCAGEPFQFTSHFFPEPESLLWDFGDGNTSTELNPVHQFAEGGEYTVHVNVVFPNGSTGEANRKVYVADLPQSALPEELVICKGTEALLDAGLFAHYKWSTGDTLQTIQISDTGYYWVEIMNDTGCMARDSLHLKWYEQPQLAAGTTISPTTCGNTIGAITGVKFTGGAPPFNGIWLNSQGDTVGTSNDLYNLGVDNYYLWVTDQNGCFIQIASFDIQNFESDLIITGVTPVNPWCNQSLGSLDVQVQSGLSDRLLYSIDNWATHQTTGIFSNLSPGAYYVKAKDSLGCEAVYIHNPVIIGSQLGVSVTGHSTAPETDNDANGSITINATGDTLMFSLNGQSPQSQPLFENLVHGEYTITISDVHGCDTTLVILVSQVSGITLYATAGDTMVCKGLRASEPLLVSNFKDIVSFEITLSYNNSLLDAVGYINAHPALISGLEPVNYPATGTIRLKWTGSSPITLPDSTILMDIVMQGKNQGLSTVDWVLTSNETSFINQYGVSVPVIPGMGSVKVAPTPDIMDFFVNKVCEFSAMSQMAIAFGGTGELKVIWQTPKGLSTGIEYKVDAARIDDAGLYKVTVIDQLNCIGTDSVQVTVVPLPAANFPESPIPFENQYTLEVPQGYASYEWNNGETNYFITVTEEGEYSVIIKTTEGCESSDTAMLVNVSVPVYVPNAFTPNGDGLNDTFKPIITKPDLVSQYHLSIYNRWGQCFFESSDPSTGWDGKDELPGVYNWVVSYMDGMGKLNQLKGVVNLIK